MNYASAWRTLRTQSPPCKTSHLLDTKETIMRTLAFRYAPFKYLFMDVRDQIFLPCDTQNSQSCWPPPQQAWTMAAASGCQSHDANSVQRNNTSRFSPATDSRYLGTRDERFSQYRSNVGIINESQHPIHQEGSCSQTQNRYYPETGSRMHFQRALQTSTSSRQQHMNPSQLAPPHQISSQALRAHEPLGQQSMPEESSVFSSHRPASFDPCIPNLCLNNSNNSNNNGNKLNEHSQQMRESWCMPPATQRPAAAGSLSYTQKSKASADAKKHLRTNTGTLTNGVSATFSQCCSTQAETVSSTQKANATELTKVRRKRQKICCMSWKVIIWKTTELEAIIAAALYAA